jgi:hypothetical protein
MVSKQIVHERPREVFRASREYTVSNRRPAMVVEASGHE